jgi:hypothetical protein
MAIAFRRAPIVEVGDLITSTQYRDQANAHNDKKRSGIGDCCWRICMWWFNWFRQVRNPSADGYSFPAQGEWFELYGLIDPESDVQWPVAGPGEPEGANLACVGMQFVHGVAPNLENEPNRLNYSDFTGLGVPLWLGNNPPETLEDFWEVGKAQRGAIDPDTGLQFVPAFQAAQSFFQITTPFYSPHGKGYGGFFPMPEKLMSDCGTTPETGQGLPSYEIFFTAQREDVSTSGFHGTPGVNADGLPTITYAGNCPFGTDFTAAGHVVGMREFPFATYVAVNNGSGGWDLDRFAKTDWIEGPYTGQGKLSRYDGGHILRGIWAFISDFKGTPGQRNPDDFNIEDIAFDFEAFLENQYALAPNIGKLSGETLEADYPRGTLSASSPQGAFLDFSGDTTHEYREGFTMAGCFAKASKLAEPVTLNVLSGTRVICSLLLTPDENQDAEAMLWLDSAEVPSPLSVSLGTPLALAAGGELIFEASEQMVYTPEIWDAYLVLRMMATHGGDAETNGVDGRGLDETRAAEFWPLFQQYGCIPNQLAAGVRDQADWVGDNPVYDAERRIARETVRIVNRRQFYSYEVAGGKSILRFKRYSWGMQSADCFYAIAPSSTPVTETIEGETYVVRGAGTVIYNTVTYEDGQTFTAIDSSEVQASGADLYAYNGIRPVAMKKGFTNEWLMFINTHCYHPSETSIFYETAYADYFTWNQRCHFWSGTAGDPDFRLHTTFGYSVTSALNAEGVAYTWTRNPEGVQAQFVSPESPSGYNYAFNANHSFGLEDHVGFCKSCQIYQEPYEVESATIEFVGAEEIVKLVFKTRFLSHPTAPATVDPDAITWSGGDISNLITEVSTGYRTDDNALREYARHVVDSTYQCVFATGDRGMGSSLPTDPDNPFGSCYPHFFFNRLMPLPYEDEDDLADPSDSRVMVDAFIQEEFEIKAMCEGFIDGITSEEITCKTTEGSLYDYKYENLCFDAFRGTEIGYRPIPNTIIRAEEFNRFSQCQNLLTKARVMLPFVVECNTENFLGDQPVSSSFPSPPFNCILADFSMALYSGGPPSVSSAGTTGWIDCAGGGSAFSEAALDGGTCPDADHFNLTAQKNTVSYRITVDADALNAIPIAWRDQIDSIGGFVGRTLTTTHTPSVQSVGAEADAEVCHGHSFWDGSTGYIFDTLIETETVCRLFSAGSFDAGTPPGGDFALIHVPASSDCGTGSSRSIDFTIYTDPGFFIDVPLVDP